MKGFKITHSMWKRFNAVLAALGDGRKTSKELAAIINMGESSMGNIISAMIHKRYIDKHRVPGVTRRFVYSQLVSEVPLSEVVGVGEVEEVASSDVPEVKLPYARQIRFDTDDMQRKLREQDKQIYAERKRKEVHIGTSWGLV
jgi:hypothetical protein